MFTKRILRVLLIAAVTLLTFNISPGAAEKLSLQPLPEASALTDMGTAFTYQGRLLDDAAPAEGQFDFQFKLFDAPSAGTQIDTTITLPNQSVSSGLFTVDLDFGENAFTGFERWLEINVRPFSIDSEPYSILLPRQQINPAPYATFARTIYRRTVVVKPVGTSLDNGTALLAALASIPVGSDYYLLKLEPGVYDIGNNSLVMQHNVDIEGSGVGTTYIRSGGYSTATEATIIGTSYAEIRDLSVECFGDGEDAYSIGMYTSWYNPQLTHVAIEAFNGTTATIAMKNVGTANPKLESVSVRSESDAGAAFGMVNNNSYVMIKDSSVYAAGVTTSTGILNENNSYGAIIESDITAGPYGVDTLTMTGIQNSNGSYLDITDSTVGAKGNHVGDVYGVFADTANLIKIINSSVEANNGDYSTEAIYITHSVGLELTNSLLNVKWGGIYNDGIRGNQTPLIIRDSQIKVNGGVYATGLWLTDTNTITSEITQSVIQASGAGPSGSIYAGSNANYGIYIDGGGTYLFLRNTILTEPEVLGNGTVEGGIGIYNDGGVVAFENSTVNSSVGLAYMGLAHIYYDSTDNQLFINNSEVYTCDDTSGCAPIYLHMPGSDPLIPVIHVSSSLLWGATVTAIDPVSIQCLWVTDENYNGFGWPAMGTVAADYACP